MISFRAAGLVACAALSMTAGCSNTVSQLDVVEIDRPMLGAPPERRDVRANEFTSSVQENTTIDLTDRGNVAVAWDSRRQQGGQYGVYARLLNARGDALTPEIQVNRFIRGRQAEPAIAYGGGVVWIAWTSHGQDGDAGSIVARMFDDHLNPLTGEIAVNEIRDGHQFRPSIAVNEFGDALIAWTSDPRDGGPSVVCTRLVSRDESVVRVERQIPASGDFSHALPVVGAQPDGSFVMAFSRTDASRQPASIIVHHIDPRGLVSNAGLVVSASLGGHMEPSLAIGREGQVSLAWMHVDESGAMSVRARRLDSRLDPLTDEQQVVVPTTQWISGVAIACDHQGIEHVAWNRMEAGGAGTNVYGVTLNEHGRPSAEPRLLTLTEFGEQRLQIASNAKRFVMSASGQSALAWFGDGGTGDDAAANVTIELPLSRAVELPAKELAASLDRTMADEIDAPIPPVFNPNWEPLPPYHGLGGDGPDFGFNAVDDTGWTPPDPEVATGPAHLLMMTNGAIAFFDKSGTLLFQDQIEGSQGFWGQQGATGFVFDPECLWDPHSQRFFAMCCERGSDGRSYYLLAVSDDANPLGTWHKYRILAPTDNDIDSPNMGIDRDVVYLTSDMFGPDKYHIFMIEKAPLLSGGTINAQKMVMTGSGEQSIGIPITFDANAPAQYMIQSSEGTGNGINFNEVRFHAIQDPLGSPTRVTVDVIVPTYSYPNQPPQAGTSSRPFLFEPRFWSCMYVNGSMWAVHHVNSSRVRARWYEFEMNGWPDSGQDPTLRQSGELDYGGQIHTFFPSIAADAQGNAVILFARSSPQEFISIGRAIRRGTDPLNTFQPMEWVKISSAPHTSGRWGDYSHIEPDPGDPGAFWGGHEWTNANGSWRTWITQVDTNPQGASTDLTGFSIVTGSLIDGDLDDLRESDDSRVRINSGFGRSLVDLHLMHLSVTANTTVTTPTAMSVSVESRINQPAGNAAVLLRNWNTNDLDTVGTYAVNDVESTHVITGIDPTNYVDGNGDIEVAIRYTVFVPIFAFQFISRFDQVLIDVQ